MPMDPSSRPSKGTMEYEFYDEKYRAIWKRGISRKIGESAFVQQTLPTYRLSFSPWKMCPFLLLLGGLFIGMGVGIKIFAKSIHEERIKYTMCSSIERPDKTCYEILEEARESKKIEGKLVNTHGQSIQVIDASEIENCTCVVNFTLAEPMNKTVYMYYSLTDFYQNHKENYQSRDENQLKGNLFDKNGKPKDPYYTCSPMDRANSTEQQRGKIIYPCGIMANSMFTDVIELIYHNYTKPAEQVLFDLGGRIVEERSTPLVVRLNKTGIAWDSDRMDKYKYPVEFLNSKHPIWANFTKPWGWKKSLWQLDPNNVTNNGVLNEDFIVWMRAAAFPWFRKLYRIVDSTDDPFKTGLPAGYYSLRIQYNYDTSAFEGEKEIIFTNSKMVAGKNTFLAITYMATGATFIALAIILFIVYACCGVSESKIMASEGKKDT